MRNTPQFDTEIDYRSLANLYDTIDRRAGKLAATFCMYCIGWILVALAMWYFFSPAVFEWSGPGTLVITFVMYIVNTINEHNMKSFEHVTRLGWQDDAVKARLQGVTRVAQEVEAKRQLAITRNMIRQQSEYERRMLTTSTQDDDGEEEEYYDLSVAEPSDQYRFS